MGLFDQLFKSLLDNAAGRIRWTPNMWAIVGSRWDKKRCKNECIAKHVQSGKPYNENRYDAEGSIFIEGKTVVLVRKSCTLCPNPPGDDFHRNSDNGYHWVPASECRKCPYYRKADKQFRFPRCTFGRSEDRAGVAKQALNDFGECLGKVDEKVKEITGEQ